MSKQVYLPIEVNSNSITFARRDNVAQVMKVIVDSKRKNVGPYVLQNVKASVKSTVPVALTGEGLPTLSEGHVIHTTISGSIENAVALRANVQLHITQLQAILEDVTEGWKPSPTTVLPVSLGE